MRALGDELRSFDSLRDRPAVGGMADRGLGRFDRSIQLPYDEICFVVFEASSVEPPRSTKRVRPERSYP